MIVNGVVMFVYRASVVVSANYWALGQAVGYLALGVVMIESIVKLMFFT